MLQSSEIHHIDLVPFTSITDGFKTSSDQIDNMSLTTLINPINKDTRKEDHVLSFHVSIRLGVSREPWKCQDDADLV